MAFRSRSAPLFLFLFINSKFRIEITQRESRGEELNGSIVKRTSTLLIQSSQSSLL
jgi:hypothetical protein